MLGHAGAGRLPSRSGAVNVMAVRHERAHEPGRRALDAAVKRVRTGDDENPHDTVSPGAGNAEACRQIIDQWKQNGARGGEAVALGAALAGATAELGG